MTVFRILLLFILGAALGGCGTMSSGIKAPTIERSPGEPTGPLGGGKTAPAKSGNKKGGGYYLDDGPGDNPPADIDTIPDAIPRVEPIKTGTSRPYSALGQSYIPMKEYQPYKAQGIASWYGRRYHGQKTASGEIYDMYGMTAAHTTLPIPSYLRITNPDNGKSVIVRVNDRGPFHSDRLIDLSYAAAYKLRIIGKGSGLVEVETIDARTFDPASVTTNPLPVATSAASGNTIADNSSSHNFIQVGAFKLKENADQLRDKLQQQKLTQNVGVENWYNDGVYRVRLGPYASRDDAETAAGQIRQTLGISAIVQNQ